jgi:hypothetical protein
VAAQLKFPHVGKPFGGGPIFSSTSPTWDRCYSFRKIFSPKNGVFSQATALKIDRNIAFLRKTPNILPKIGKNR